MKVSKVKATTIFSNIEKYKPVNKFQHATWLLIVIRFADKKEKHDIKELFNALDGDGDGELSIEDMKKGFKTTLGIKTKEIIEEIFSLVKPDHKGRISITEFTALGIDK